MEKSLEAKEPIDSAKQLTVSKKIKALKEHILHQLEKWLDPIIFKEFYCDENGTFISYPHDTPSIKNCKEILNALTALEKLSESLLNPKAVWELYKASRNVDYKSIKDMTQHFYYVLQNPSNILGGISAYLPQLTAGTGANETSLTEIFGLQTPAPRIISYAKL